MSNETEQRAPNTATNTATNTAANTATNTWSDAAFGAVFEQHHTRLYRLACLLTGDVNVADEVTAEVFARLLPKWRAGKVEDPLAYLRRSLVNEIRSRHRRRTYETRAAERWNAHPRFPSESLEVRLTDQPLIAALTRLPPRQRAVVVLRYHDDVSEADVARTLGMAIGSVKSHASRGLAELRRLLDDGSNSRRNPDES